MPDGSPGGTPPSKGRREGWDRVLVALVSDQTWTKDLLRDACDREDFEVRQLPRSDDAFERIVRMAASVIVVDISGGDPAPFDLLRQLQAAPETRSLPTLALSPTPDPLARAAAIAVGVEDVAHRGVDPEELQSRLKTLARLANAAMRDQEHEASLHRLQVRLRERGRELEESHRLVEHMRHSLQADQHTQRSRVEGLVQVAMELNKLQDFHVLMDRILKEARRLIHADAGTIYIREGKLLRFAYAQNDTLDRDAVGSPRFSSFLLPVGDGSIAGWVSASGEAVNLADAYELDSRAPYRFDRSFDQMTGYRTRSVLAMPLRTSMGRVVGVLQVMNATGSDGRSRPRFNDDDVTLLGHFASMATVAIERTQLTESIINRMLRMTETIDPDETGRHTEKVAGMSAILFEGWAQRRGLEGPAFERQRDRLRIAAKLHDVGKVGIDNRILKKPRGVPLTPEEFAEVRRHVIIGASFFLDNPTEVDEVARDVALNHHERWDGSGYPGHVDVFGHPIPDPATGLPRTGGKKGLEIPLFARIVGLADVVDALASERCYKPAWEERRVLEEVRAHAGRHFDPELVEIFFERLEAIRELRRALGP